MVRLTTDPPPLILSWNEALGILAPPHMIPCSPYDSDDMKSVRFYVEISFIIRQSLEMERDRQVEREGALVIVYCCASSSKLK